MKFVFGNGSAGTPIPRALNPLFMVGLSIACFIGAGVFLFVGALSLLLAPFSFLGIIRKVG